MSTSSGIESTRSVIGDIITVVYRQGLFEQTLSFMRTLILLSTFMLQGKSLPPLHTQIGLINLETAYKRALTISTTTNS
jgi:hypothetical protein